MLKKIVLLSGLSVAALGLTASSVSADQTPRNVDLYYVAMHFTFDGKEYAPSAAQQGFIYDGSTYVPLRFVSYSLNKAVEWNQDTYQVTVREPQQSEKVTIDDFKLNAEVRGEDSKKERGPIEPTNTEAYFETIHYMFDGKTVTPPEDKPGIIMDGTLFVPIRFYSESVGKQIDWNQETYTVSASIIPEKKEEKPAPAKDQNPGVPAAPTIPVIVPPGGGSNTSGPSNPSNPGGIIVSKTDIENDAKAQITALKAEAEGYFSSLLLKYLVEPNNDAATNQKYKAMGQAAMAGYDSRFESIINILTSNLTANRYSTEIVSSLRADYAANKLQGINALPQALRDKAKALLGL